MWEWRIFGQLDLLKIKQIQVFPKKFDKSYTIEDRYLWYPGCNTNIKFRTSDLKIKKCVDIDENGIEKREVYFYQFPLCDNTLNNIKAQLSLNLPKNIIKNEKELIQIVKTIQPSLQLITVKKQRQSYYGPNNKNLTVELAEILSPEKISTVSIESENYDDIIFFLNEFSLIDIGKDSKIASPIYVINYLTAIEKWAKGKTII